MRKFFILFILILINLNFFTKLSLASPCDGISVEWNRWEKKGYASFTFKSTSSSTVKIYDVQLLTSGDTVITTFKDIFYIAPYNAVRRSFYIENLNQDVIKTASHSCTAENEKTVVKEPKKTGAKYVNSVQWKYNSPMAYNDCGTIGVSCDAWLGVSASRNYANIGDKISVYNKNGKLIETFEVKKIYLDYDKNQCWVSKLNKEKFKDYLSIQNCTGN
jgi:hypothetical protein